MPNYLKKWVLKEENNSRDSMGEEVFNEVE